MDGTACSATLEVGNDVGTLRWVSDASESHRVAGSELGRSGEPLVEVTVSPLDGGLGGEGARIGETLRRGDVLSGQTT